MKCQSNNSDDDQSYDQEDEEDVNNTHFSDITEGEVEIMSAARKIYATGPF